MCLAMFTSTPNSFSTSFFASSTVMYLLLKTYPFPHLPHTGIRHIQPADNAFANVYGLYSSVSSVGKAIASPVEFVDIYPTLCDLAGFEKPGHLEGDSFAELLQNPSGPRKRAAFSQYPRGNIMGYSMTTDRFRYTEWVDQKKDNEVVFAELYDHQDDPQDAEWELTTH